MNLLNETLKALETHNISAEDVLWVGSMDGKMAIRWDAFELIADKTNYNNGYGGVEIADDLVVVGNGWWLERGEYDGSEWWEFKTMPARVVAPKPFESVYSDGWKSLASINGIVE